jgi:hypothetical protein
MLNKNSQRCASLALAVFFAAAQASAANVAGYEAPIGGDIAVPDLSAIGAVVTPGTGLSGTSRSPSLISELSISAVPTVSVSPAPVSMSLPTPAAEPQAGHPQQSISASGRSLPSGLSHNTATSLDRLLGGVSSESLQKPQQRDAVLARLWDHALRGLRGTEQDGDIAIVADQAYAGGLFPAAKASELGARQEQTNSLPSPAIPRTSKGSRQVWEANQYTILVQAQSLRMRVDALASQDMSEWGPQRFESAIDKGEVAVEDPVLGRGEVNSLQVNGKRVLFTRVAHAPTELAIYFLDQEAVPQDSRHLRQILARQVIDAGSHRKDGKTGRDVVIVWERAGVVVAKEFHGKPARLSAAWWKAFWYATYKTPAKTDVWFGVLMGAVQGLLAMGLGFLKLLMCAGAVMSWTPVFYTFAFGALIGAFISTYKYWTYRGTWLQQFLKQALISVVFAYPVVASTQGLSALGLAATHIHVFSNVALNNVGKTIWTQIPRMGDKHRQFTKPLPGGFSRSGAVNQFFYMINWTLRLADLIQVPGGKIIFLATMPLGSLLNYWYAKAHDFPEAEQMRQAPRRWLQKWSRIFSR